jgi:hypothetical protein
LILGLGYTRSFNTRSSGSLNVNWSRQQYQDLAAKKLSQDLLGDQVVLSAFVSVGASSFNASAGFGSTEQPSVASAATALGGDLAPKSGNSFNASLRWNQAWVRAVLDSYLGYDLNSSSTETKPFGIIAAGTKSLTNRSTFSLGGGWNFREDQRLGLRFALATLATEDKAATVSTENVSQLHSHVSYDLSF